MAHAAAAAPRAMRCTADLKLWHFALLGACSLAIAYLGPLTRPLAPCYPLWALLAAHAGRGRATAAAAGRGAACLASAAAGFLLPGTLTGQIIQSFTAQAWLTALAGAGGALTATAGSLATTPVRTAAARAAASAAFLATPALWWNQYPFPLALTMACCAAILLQARAPRRQRLLAAALTAPFTALALLLVLTAPSLLTRLPVI
ncbi:hypothetical protein ACFYUY_39520 [Kitasatospora sp. NPDC004745]|uniref:hypothetical protein n=1 Tax=Kitasatospora sp. NPDC004745 TaxID=3364019 RepID=UPI0036A0F4F5